MRERVREKPPSFLLEHFNGVVVVRRLPYKSKTVVIGWILLLFLFSIAHIQLEETEWGKREKSCTSFDVVCFISFRIILLLLLFLLDSMRTIVLRSKRASRATCRRCANGAFFDDWDLTCHSPPSHNHFFFFYLRQHFSSSSIWALLFLGSLMSFSAYISLLRVAQARRSR